MQVDMQMDMEKTPSLNCPYPLKGLLGYTIINGWVSVNTLLKDMDVE